MFIVYCKIAECKFEIPLNFRPINVTSKWNSTRMGNEDYHRQRNMKPPFSINNHHPFGLNRRNSSPETISLEPISNGSFRVSADDMEVNSPLSAVSSVCPSLDQETKGCEVEGEVLEEEEEDEAMSSYVIEINSENREGTCESNGVDEAIAWAKEKFQTHFLESKWSGQECEAEKTTQGSSHLSSPCFVAVSFNSVN